MQILVTTTGTQSSVTIDSGRVLTHPITIDIYPEFSLNKIQKSTLIQNAINAGHITVADENGQAITNICNAIFAGLTSDNLKEGTTKCYVSPAQKDALVGTSSVPGTTNRYVTNADPRLSDSRFPSGTAGGDLTGTYPNPGVSKLKGKTIDDAAIGDDKILVYKTTGDKIVYEAKLTASVFGTQFQYVSDEPETQTTSLSYQEKLKLTTLSLPSGTYRINWYAEWNGSTTEDIKLRVQLNDITDISMVNIEQQDNTSFIDFNGFYVQILSGINTIDMDYASENGAIVKIRRARIEIWRVL